MPTNPQIETEIDRLARALHGAGEQNGAYLPFEDVIGIRRDQVRAVLLALREPSEAMGMASFDATSHLGDRASTAEEYLSVWQGMIDHILNESDGQ